MNTDLIYRAIGEDHRLEAEVDNAIAALAKHRWHWTRDTTNPDRFNDAEYAERLGSTRAEIDSLVEELTRLTGLTARVHRSIWSAS